MFIDPLRALVAAVLWPITMPAVGAVFAAQDIMARLEGGE